MAVHGSKNKMVKSGNYLGNISRTKVKNIYDFRTTFSAGKLFPIYAQEIYPSMNDGINCAELVRSITPLGPTMDNSFLDIFYFFVPARLLWDHWEEFIAGYNKEAWAQDVEYSVPQIKFKGSYIASSNTGGDKTPDSFIHSFLDYLPGACDVCTLPEIADAYGQTVEGVTTYDEIGINDLVSISALFPRAYCKIWNDWFRDENLQDELEIYTGDNDEYADEFSFNLLDPDELPSANKLHNRFTTALPAPVKGPDVLIPMNNLLVQAGANHDLKGSITFGSGTYPEFQNANLGINGDKKLVGASDSVTYAEGTVISKTNLVANNVSNTIRMLRLATQTELLLARDARGGTRYTESILSHFKVHNGDARLQRSEYLGSRSIPLNVQQVTNTAQAGDNALGNVGGQSVTRDNYFYFNKAFSEWGIILGLATVRTSISHSSGIRKMYQRKGRFDFIWPEFKHVGDVPLYTKEVRVNKEVEPDMVFGYTPYGSELRTGYNFNNGLFRPDATGSLAYLTYQEEYIEEDIPRLSADWIKQPSDVVSRTLVTQTGPQFYALFHIEEELVIPLDPTSDPGLMDHF